eukprot:COSAG02_NODE_51764_length_312_cov_0.713615_1_plen_22_part_10
MISSCMSYNGLLVLDLASSLLA